MNKWTSHTVSEIADKKKNAIVGGPFGSDLVSKDYYAFGVPVIRGANMGGGRWVAGNFVYVSEEKASSLAANCAEPGDLVFTQRGTIGQVALVPHNEFPKYLISQSQMKLSVDSDKADSMFLYYIFTGKQQQKYIQQNAIRTGVPHTNLGILKDTPLFIPPLPKQKKISSFLNAIDSKIELNNKINNELEAMAKLIYEYWFVQFDFPDAEGKPYKSSGGKMVYNEEIKREIPDGWDSDYIGNLLAKEPRTKKLPRTEYLSEGKIPVIDQSTDYICGYTNDNDTLITTEAPRIVFGDHTRILKLVNFDFARGADGTQVLLSNNKNVPQHFFYHSLLKVDLSNYGYARHFKFLKQTRIIIPNQDLVSLFEDKVTSFYDQIKHNVFETNKLIELRDWLLPMLMNGQVTVKDAA